MAGRGDNRPSTRVAVLTISDRCSRGETEDLSGPFIANYLTERGHQIIHKYCIPDDFQIIQDVLMDWSDSTMIDLIVTTGGTGFTDRDITPEATKSVIERETPGIVIGMIINGIKSTNFAMLSRPCAGIRKSTLIVNLPGSVKACKEYLQILEPIVNHGIDQLRGDKLRVKVKHTEMQEPSKPVVLTIKDPNEPSNLNLRSPRTPTTTGQPFTSSAPSLLRSPGSSTTCTSSQGASPCTAEVKSVCSGTAGGFQYRKSPYEMVTTKEAVSRILAELNSTEKLELETIPLKNSLDLLDRRAASDIQSKVDVPAFPASIKDGYAVVTSDGSGTRKVISSSITAGLPVDGMTVDKGWCIRINTGAPVPDGCDAVVQVEDTEVTSRAEDGQEVEINITTAPKMGLDIRRKGSDIKRGETVIRSGDKLGPIELGILASIGINQVPVYRRPKVAILSTGDELREPGENLIGGSIWDCNRITLISFLKRRNTDVIDLGIVEDDLRSLESRICSGLERSDLLITTGGVSMGEKDILKTVLTHCFGAKIHFGRVNMKPGKPTTFATCTTTTSENRQSRRFIFSLPGNPVSAFVSCLLFVIPVLDYLSGHPLSPTANNNTNDILDLHPWIRVNLTLPTSNPTIKLDERPEFARAIVHFEGASQLPSASMIKGSQKSSRLTSVKDANALVIIPGREEVPGGTIRNNFITKAILINF